MNHFWCWGDSVAMDFNITASPAMSVVRSRGSAASIADSSGNLILYSAYDTTAILAGTAGVAAYNKNHQLLLNGHGIKDGGWYHEIVIVPYPGSDTLFCIFSIGVTGPFFGLYYSIVNIAKDSVIQKNIQLMPDQQADCIYAVKHGNGRDWWVVGRRLWFSLAQWNNEYWRVLVTPNGVYGPFFQNIGDTIYSGFCRISFSPTGDTLLYTNAGNVIQYFNFDRCTGLLSNYVSVRPNATVYSDWTWSNEFSSNGRFLYTSTSKDTTQLFQYDLYSPNPLATRVTLYQSPFPRYSGGDVKRGPDGKIYFSIAYITNQVSYPYPDSVYNNYNMYLSVINQPDSLGTACDFQPYSFYLGGKRTYYGLPNNPDYHLGPKIGSGCDTLTAINEHSQNLVISNLSPNPNMGEFTVNYFLPNGKSGELEVFNLTGQRIFYQPLPRYTYMQNIHLKNQPKGIYLLKISGGGKVAVRKFVVSK